MSQVRRLMLEPALRQDLQDRVNELGLPENCVCDTVIEIGDVSAAEVVGKVRCRELQCVSFEAHDGSRDRVAGRATSPIAGLLGSFGW